MRGLASWESSPKSSPDEKTGTVAAFDIDADAKVPAAAQHLRELLRQHASVILEEQHRELTRHLENMEKSAVQYCVDGLGVSGDAGLSFSDSSKQVTISAHISEKSAEAPEAPETPAMPLIVQQLAGGDESPLNGDESPVSVRKLPPNHCECDSPQSQGHGSPPHGQFGSTTLFQSSTCENIGSSFGSSFYEPNHQSFGNSFENAQRKKAESKAKQIRNEDGPPRRQQTDPSIKLQPLRHKAKRLVAHKLFDLTSALLIISNAAFIGVQAQCCSHPDNENETLNACFSVYTILFLIELLIRLFAFRLDFFIDQTWAWNLTDFVIVLISVLEAIIQLAAGDAGDGAQGFSMVRMVRIMRIVRIVRIIRIFRFFKDLRVLVLSIMSAMRSLFWALILLSLIMYGYAVIFTQAYVGSLDPRVTTDGRLLKYYSTLPRSIFTLFISISGGISWVEVIEPLSLISQAYVVLFLSFVCFIVFAVLNVVTGVFCQNAIESAARDEEEVISEMLKQKQVYIKRLQFIFEDFESAGRGCMTLTDFEEKLADERVKAWFRMLDLEVNDAWTLFKLLDVDGTGLVDLDEFVTGCLQLRGSAKCMDVAKVSQENKLILRAIDKVNRQILGQLSLKKVESASNTWKMSTQKKGMLTKKMPLPLLRAIGRSTDSIPEGHEEAPLVPEETPLVSNFFKQSL